MPRAPPIPRRIPPLVWRKPAWVWTPVALMLAVGWPPVLVWSDGPLARTALLAGAAAFAATLAALGAAWLAKRSPQTYRDVIAYVLMSSAVAAVAAPFLFASLIETLAQTSQAHSGLGWDATLAMVPLALLIGLPAALISGAVFAFVTFVKPPREPPRIHDGHENRSEFQPFV